MQTGVVHMNSQTAFSTLLCFLIVGLLSFFVTPTFCIDKIQGVQPQKLANGIYAKERGDGYQGTFFIKSKQLVDVSNKMLKKSGVNYSISQYRTESEGMYVTLSDALTGEKTVKKTSLAPSFVDVNTQTVKDIKTPTHKTAMYSDSGLLFADVAGGVRQ